ncbi:pyruvate phosphate dikinase PEP/pyruvate-binding protein [Desulfovibrio sp. X2]|uniref:PEP/pyruvate-binding domain-containing protein n=1 Tax=Desulfovibrio sp. X2 TaxID=941449 RepID=UPI000358BE6A|nr:PEP/pyruvate-binding domain-containing protein [Desulfovibrio sp. X2]EPR41589.1 pyruvate phosphate dikinase PEP/pyruvate-binding protein [Desulfovibrio sp. X2]
MTRLCEQVRAWLRGSPADLGPAGEDPAAAAAREAVRARGRQFRRLIAANAQGLRAMAELEEAMAGTRTFDMAWLRAHAVAACSAVYQMVFGLSALAPEHGVGLAERFTLIRREMDTLLAPREPAAGAEAPLVLPLAEVRATHAPVCGGKMAMLGELGAHGLPVPEGFVVTTAAYRRFLQSNGLGAAIDGLIQGADSDRLDALMSLSAAVQGLILRTPVPPDLAEAVLAACDGLPPRTPGTDGPPRLAVRSSALGEDAAGASFAGQYHSELNVGREGLLDSYREVVASKYGVAAMAYRRGKGLRDEDVAMCVGCLRMVRAEAGGVIYTRSPVDPDDDAVSVTATPGLPKAIVDGGVTPDVFEVARGEGGAPPSIRSRRIAQKSLRLDSAPGEGLARSRLSAAASAAPSIDDEAVLTLASLALRVEDLLGEAQDIEWALGRSGRFYLLQTRALPRQACRAQGQARGESRAGGRERTVPADARLLAEGGVTASGGVGAGQVHVVDKEADFLSFPRGGVLVAATSSPRLAALLSRAAAVVAEHGSVAGHLASVAREFGVPALFGVSDAPRVLSGAGLVTVDADGRAVYSGEVSSLLAPAPAGQPASCPLSGPGVPPPDSPVRRTLERLAALVVPLGLLDPEAPDFVPAKCRSLHDITRYCHEMAVRAMFSDEGQAAEAAASGKRLAVGRATKYWVVDLGGGFVGDVPGPAVKLSEIACAPMLAVWAGMTAIPWQGPPMPDARGFLSLVAQSAANRDIEPGLDSAFAERDYFLVSRRSCTVQARFGYHFCTVDCHAGPRPEENYAAFQFKGGAADLPRRRARAEMVGRLLARRGFISEARQDALYARLENAPREEMLRHVMVLGHLLVHTRQIDMVMGDPATVAAWEERLGEECGRVAALPLPLPAGNGGEDDDPASNDPGGDAVPHSPSDIRTSRTDAAQSE